MKNPTLLLTPDAVHDYMAGLFRTNIFRDSLRENNGYIQKLVKAFAAKPRLFFEMSDPGIERAHFYTWMGASPLREYVNDAVHDLYYHHEMWHSISMPYYPDMEFDGWKQKMIDNEFYSSLESEALIYFVLPGLRETAFSFPIWADRFLENKNPHMPLAAVRTMLANERRRAMKTPLDAVEQHVADYVKSNDEWSRIWAKNYNTVEQHMYLHNLLGPSTPTETMRQHLAFFDKNSTPDSGVPFHQEAVDFQAVFQQLFTPAA